MYNREMRVRQELADDNIDAQHEENRRDGISDQ